MNKLLPWVLIFIILAGIVGSMDVPVPYLPLATGDGYIPLQGVCCAPPSLLPALCDRVPALKQAPDFITRSEKLVDAWMPDIKLPLPADSGAMIDSIIVKAAPHFL